MAERTKVLYAINRMEVGGSQTHLIQVLHHLDRRRFEPILCCLIGQGALLGAARDSGTTVVGGYLSSGLKSPALLPNLLRFVRYLRRERVDIVHNYLLRANVIGGLAARLARVPVVLASKRGCHERRGFELAGARLANRLADRVTANSEAVRAFVHANEGCPLEKMVVIPSGIDTDRFRPLGGDDFKARLGLDPRWTVVGSATRLRVRKGVEEFLRAMGALRERLPNVHTVVAGEVALDDEVARLVRACGLESHLHLLGRRSDMPEVLSAFDVFVLSSHGEGMSNAILEAMAMERPVVATGVGGTVEVVQPGRTGLLVPAKDPAALAEAIAAMLAMPASERAAMGRLGRQVVVERFSARAMVRQMEDLYAALLRERGVRLPAGAALPATP